MSKQARERNSRARRHLLCARALHLRPASEATAVSLGGARNPAWTGLPMSVRSRMAAMSPNATPRLTTLLPSESPSATSGDPAMAEKMPTEASGLLVANAAMVIPVIALGMRNSPAMATSDLSKISPPTPTLITPNASSHHGPRDAARSPPRSSISTRLPKLGVSQRQPERRRLCSAPAPQLPGFMFMALSPLSSHRPAAP